MSPATVGWVQDMHPAGQTVGCLHLCWLWSAGARAVLHLQFALIPNLHCILGDLAGGFIFQRVFHSKRVCKCEFKSVISFPLSSKHLFHHFKWFLNGCNALDLPAEITSVLSSKPEFLSPLALCSLQIIQWEFIWKEVVGHKWSKMLTAGVPTQSLLMWKAGSQI